MCYHYLKSLYGYFAGIQILLIFVLLIIYACTPEESSTESKIIDLSTVLTIDGSDNFDPDSYISSKRAPGYFPLSENGESAPIVISESDFRGVLKIANQLKTDIFRVTNSEPLIYKDSVPKNPGLIIIGTIDKSPVIEKLVSNGKINLTDLIGKWEMFITQIVDQPFEGVDKALVIAGSDKRGTIYGMYDLSEKIGVSPWYWWADVPVKTHAMLFVKPGRHTNGEPAVKYRGIFINDEAPALSGWAHEKFGGFNHEFYEKVYELILRLNGNYLWPAMWGRSLFDDDSLSAPLADEYGIVIGTTHHEPMMRSHVEWERYGKGSWNYEKNAEQLKDFWRKGLERMGNNESIVSVGMRGDGDMAMSEESNIALLQKIIEVQRQIVEDVTGKPASETPQLWALYKEVQDYYNKGMRVPEDITLLLCDDNWGNHRILPKPGSKPRQGGYGVYYHFDFVGGPRNYKWLNTSPISRVWEQMNLAYRHGVDRIWLVNVGDLKPMELPISFFLDFAWNPNKIPAADIPEYHIRWAKQQFGGKYAKEISDILMKYTKFNSRRKPESIGPDTYSLINYREAETIVKEYNDLAERAKLIYEKIPEVQKDAYYQLVLYPVLACANLNELHVSRGLNYLYAEQGRVSANSMARKIEQLFAKDQSLSSYFHDTLSNGKWNHLMSQTHISYTYWQQPDEDVLPELKTVKPGEKAEMGVAIEGDSAWWPEEEQQAVLSEFDVYQQQKHYIEIFNRGGAPFNFHVEAGKPWVEISNASGRIEEQERIWVDINWPGVPNGFHQVPIKISGPGDTSVEVIAEVRNPPSPKREEVNGYMEGNGYISIEAVNYVNLVESEQITWQVIPDLGRTGSSITSFPVTAPRESLSANPPRIEYKINLLNEGKVKVMVYVAPTLNIYSTEGLKYAISIDDETPQIVNIHEGDTIPDWNYPAWWNNAVMQNIKVSTSEHMVNEPGEHILKYWMVDPAILLQKIVVVTNEIKPSYLGPPESYYGGIHNGSVIY